MAPVCNTTVACHIQTTRPRKFTRYVRIKHRVLVDCGCVVEDLPYVADALDAVNFIPSTVFNVTGY